MLQNNWSLGESIRKHRKKYIAIYAILLCLAIWQNGFQGVLAGIIFGIFAVYIMHPDVVDHKNNMEDEKNADTEP